MGACLPKSPTCGEVNPSTKLFNVCCGGWVIIENSKIDGANGRKEGHYLKQKNNKKINTVYTRCFITCLNQVRIRVKQTYTMMHVVFSLGLHRPMLIAGSRVS